ncbi:HAD family hydrolase [Streptomyces sp. APSN-46.1]|uniref:HAD family hydrolase n=1 Tax=Streptomyces sp. APSN-46.1 TaxID=2929049 RepID=UPI001FB23287|nr:HAD family hydrolase [Streptomyces sp. APSN-46.1]MCJ1676240.1 HAD family hydrolase [Streptomyces sp. APSN-46.1]
MLVSPQPAWSQWVISANAVRIASSSGRAHAVVMMWVAVCPTRRGRCRSRPGRGHTGPVAVASANDGRIGRAGIAVAGLAHLFPVIVAREDVVRLEPAPDAYLTAATRLGLEPASCIAYETDEGISAAHTARMDVIDIRTAPWTIDQPPPPS